MSTTATRPPATTPPELGAHEVPRGPHLAGSSRRRGAIGEFLGYAWGIVVHPRATIDALAQETSVCWAVVVATLGVAQVWGNTLLFAVFGYDWLGTRPLLADPTYVGYFGYLRVPAVRWVPVFAALMPALALYGLVVVPGVAHLPSKLWGGRGTFEQMVNMLTFAAVPGVAIGWVSEWLTGVPLNLLSGQPYFYAAAMQGAYGPAVATMWTVYAAAIYVISWTWSIALGVLAIHRVQRIPLWAATATMLVAFSLSLLITSTFVR